MCEHDRMAISPHSLRETVCTVPRGPMIQVALETHLPTSYRLDPCNICAIRSRFTPCRKQPVQYNLYALPEPGTTRH